MAKKTFAVSGQHYLFSVQAFAKTILSAGGDEYDYELLDRTLKGVIADVQSGESEIGVICEGTPTAPKIEAALAEAGLEFHALTESAPKVALPAASHPLVNAKSLVIEDLADYPYVYFEQEDDAPLAFYEEALSNVERARKIATTDRASLSELICALNGYTVTSGILVGISDGTLLTTVPLETDFVIKLGYVSKKGEELDGLAKKFVDTLSRSLERYARL